MSHTLDGLYRALMPLRLYALHKDSLIDKELAAYGAAFAVLEEILVEIERQAFVQTATGDALARHEKLVGLAPRLGLDDETRRSLVRYRLGAAPFDFNREGMINSIRAAGMEAELEEDPSGESLTVRYLELVDPSLDIDELMANVRTVLPAHLLAEFDIGDLTWDMLDVIWDEWDAADMIWNDFDFKGHFIFNEQGE